MLYTGCVYCTSNDIVKNGILPRGGQRYVCKGCNKHFTLGGTSRGTYDTHFKEKIIDMYCHLHRGARKLATTFHISTSTLVQWSKEHKQTCKTCNKKVK